jgi:hypothetical protein
MFAAVCLNPDSPVIPFDSGCSFFGRRLAHSNHKADGAPQLALVGFPYRGNAWDVITVIHGDSKR